MKPVTFFFLVFSLFFLTVVGFAQEKAKIVFDKLEHNFGTFKETAGVQTYSFKFTNKGKVPLILNSVSASCGCTTPKWTNQPVVPEGKGEIQVSYDPTNRLGTFAKTVTIQSNAENATVILTISGTAVEREKTLAELYPEQIGMLRVKSSHIYIPKLYTDELKTETLEMVNESDKPVKVGFRTVPEHLKATVTPQTIPANGKAMVNVVYNARIANTYGFVTHRIYLSLNGSEDYNYSFGISANIEENFTKLTPQQLADAPVANFPELAFDYGDIKQEGTYDHTFILSNSGKSALIIRNVSSSCGCTAVAPSKSNLAPGESVPVKVAFDARGKKGRQSKTITVITNDPKNPISTLRVSSNVIAPE